MTEWLERQIKRHGTWLLRVLVAVLLIPVIPVLFCRAPDKTVDRAQIATACFAGIALLIALVQAKWASQQAEKASQQTEQALTTDVLFRLYEMYMRRDMHRAIGDIWRAMKQEGSGMDKMWKFLERPDRYQFLEEYISKQEKGKKDELNESRRMVTHFWYLIANLLNQGMLREQDVFEWFGPPDVIWVLEGLEVIKQKLEMTGGAQKTRWPPLQVLGRYYKSKGISVEALDSATIPIVHIDRETVKRIKDL